MNKDYFDAFIGFAKHNDLMSHPVMEVCQKFTDDLDDIYKSNEENFDDETW